LRPSDFQPKTKGHAFIYSYIRAIPQINGRCPSPEYHQSCYSMESRVHRVCNLERIRRVARVKETKRMWRWIGSPSSACKLASLFRVGFKPLDQILNRGPHILHHAAHLTELPQPPFELAAVVCMACPLRGGLWGAVEMCLITRHRLGCAALMPIVKIVISCETKTKWTMLLRGNGTARRAQQSRIMHKFPYRSLQKERTGTINEFSILSLK
jgi:hypothetical protein